MGPNIIENLSRPSVNFKENFNFKYLLLIIPLFLGYDFLPLWFILTYTTLLIYISLFRPWRFLDLINFGAVFFVFKTVGKQIIPETMVPVLGIFLISRFLSNKRNKEFEMYPLFLWIGIFSLFSSSFYYLLK